MRKTFWNGRKVLVTGHTGFKGSWLSLWLQYLGAEVVGVSLDPPTVTNLYEKGGIAKEMQSLREDIRNGDAVKSVFKQHRPEIVFHLAAQPLVRYSYRNPLETYEVNVMGTLNILEGMRSVDSVRSAVMVTTDKCYKNEEWEWGYREIDPIGGHDPYSSSKGAMELLISSYRDSYYPSSFYEQHKTALASVRAGNVIGGGDWAEDRLIPDIIRAFQAGDCVKIRNPHAIRPWQHVLEPLSGYLQLAEMLNSVDGSDYAEAWNFGPQEGGARSVEWIVNKIAEQWGNGASWTIDQDDDQPHEASYLKLDCSKANSKLEWHAKWSLYTALSKVVQWHKSEYLDKNSCKEMCLSQINQYMDCIDDENC